MMFKKSNGDEKKGKPASHEAVGEFLKKNPNPSDPKFHRWAEGKGVNVHDAERHAYHWATMAAKVMKGGKSKGQVPSGVSSKSVKEGTKVEKEHTSDDAVARKITLDHLKEHKGYYPALKKMEKDLEKDGGVGRVFGRAKYRWEQMQKDKKAKKPKVETPSDLMEFLKSRGHRVSSSPLKEKVGEAFVDELDKISSSLAERSGRWIGRKLSGIRGVPGEFISSVKKGYKGTPPTPTGPIHTPSERNIHGGDPRIAAMVKKTMAAKAQSRKSKLQVASTKSLKPTFPSKKVKLPSSGTSSAATRALIR
jgi:hypothetical protein